MAGYLTSAGYPVACSDAPAAPLWSIACRILPDKTLACLTGLLLTAAGAFLIHRVNYLRAIIREKSLMPFFLYILFISSNPGFFPLNPVSPAIFCLILAFDQLLTSYHDPGAVRNTFNAAFYIGLASLFWVHILWLLPVFWWGMNTFKVLNLRTFLASLTGVGVIYWLLLGWHVWKSGYAPVRLPFVPLLEPAFPAAGNLHLTDWICVLYIVFLTSTAIVNILLHENEDSLRTRQFLQFLVLLFAVTSGLFLFYQQSSDEFLAVMCIPVSILVSHFFSVQTGKKMFYLYYVLISVFIILSLMRSPWISLLNTVT
jgi:hypothetical protein